VRVANEKGERMRVLHLEDNGVKHATITRVVKDTVRAQVDWVQDVESGMKKIAEAKLEGKPYDVAITDMHYPLEPDGEADHLAGEKFLAKVIEAGEKLPVIIMSTHNMTEKDAFGCVWYREDLDWEFELRKLLKKI